MRYDRSAKISKSKQMTHSKPRIYIYKNNRYCDTYRHGEEPNKDSILEIEVSKKQIVFHKRNSKYSYIWTDFTEALFESKISLTGGSISARNIKKRTLFLKTKDGEQYILDLSIGYGNNKNESEFTPMPKELLSLALKNLEPILVRKTNYLKVRWFTPLGACFLVAIPTSVFFLLVRTVYIFCIATIISLLVWLAYYLNSNNWIVDKPKS